MQSLALGEGLFHLNEPLTVKNILSIFLLLKDTIKLLHILIA